jgi:hypothetical protein
MTQRVSECVMPKSCDPDSNIDALTDTEIHNAIRYLEPNSPSTDDRHADDPDKNNGVVVCICLYIAVLICLSFVWFYRG